MNSRISDTIGCLILVTALTGCGHTTGDRAVSGAAIGAAAGTVGAAVTGGALGTGAAIGAAAGAAVGAISDDDEIDLGEPAWKK